MAASGLDHLKNDYRRRFCRPSRVLDIDTKKGQNILNIIQDCFEEYSVDSSLGTNSTKSVLYSASKVGKGCIPSPHKERQCQKLPRESVGVSSEKKEGTLQLTEELGHAVNRSVQIQDVHEKILTTNVSSKNKPDSRRMSSRNQKDHHDEEKAEFYLSPSVDQKKETYTSENSVNKLSSSTKISLKTKKRLNFEDIDVSKKTEVESIVTEEPQQRTPSGASQKVVQELEYDQPQTAKCFSTLFLETFRRKDESSPVVKCAVTTPPPSSPISDMKLLEDEFVIEESDRSVDGKLRFTIPRKAGRTKQNTGSSAERTATILQSKKSRGEHPSQSATLTQDTPAKACPGEKSQPTAQTKLAWDHVITDEMENNCRSSKSEIHSKNAEKSSVRKRTRKENQRSNLKACVVEEQVAMEQTEDKNINRSSIAQDKLRRNLDLNVEESGKMSSDHISPKQMQPVGSNKSKTSVPFSKNQKKEREHKKKHSSNRSKMNKLVPEEGSLTARRSQRVSRPPSDWWIVKSDQSDDFGSSSPAVDELPLHRSSRQKPVKANNGPGSPGEKLMPHTEPQTDTRRKPRAQKVSESAPSRESTPHDETSSSQESLGSKEADLAKKKKSPPSGRKGSSEARNSIAVQNVHLPSRTSECTTPSACNSESGEAQISFFEESGPSRVKNHLSAKNNSDVDDTEVFENSNASRVKECKEIPENEIHHKLVLPTDTPNVRRTKRIRLRRLEYWRGERADYRIRPSGGCVVAGILSPDTVSSKRKAKENTGKVNRKYNGKRMCLGNNERTKKLIKDLPVQLGDPLQPTLVKDPDTKELVLLDLIRQRDSYQFLVQHNELKVYKTLDTPFFSTGKLVLGPHQEKGKQHVGSDILVFYVNFGELLCTLHETPYIITTGDSFYIPSGNYYNIKNLLNEESIILFTQIKR